MRNGTVAPAGNALVRKPPPKRRSPKAPSRSSRTGPRTVELSVRLTSDDEVRALNAAMARQGQADQRPLLPDGRGRRARAVRRGRARADARRHRPRPRRVRSARPPRRRSRVEQPRRASDRPRHAPPARLRPSGRRATPPTWRRARSAPWPGSASPIPMRGDALMATPQDDDGGSRLWRGMRSLIFGDDGETDACATRSRKRSTRPRTAQPVAGDLSPARAADAAQPAALRRPAPPATSASPAATSSRCPSTISFDELDPRLRRRRPQPPAGLWREPR